MLNVSAPALCGCHCSSREFKNVVKFSAPDPQTTTTRVDVVSLRRTMQCILATVPREPHTRSAPHAHHATCTAVYYIRHCSWLRSPGQTVPVYLASSTTPMYAPATTQGLTHVLRASTGPKNQQIIIINQRWWRVGLEK